LGIAHDVAARRLDLDHLGTQVAEDLRRERPKYHGGEVEYLDAGEGSRLGFTHRVIFPNLQSKRASNISPRCICSKSAAKSLVKIAPIARSDGRSLDCSHQKLCTLKQAILWSAIERHHVG